MKTVPGKARTCPICRATILESASVCPGCRHHLRFEGGPSSKRAWTSFSPLRVDGTIRHPEKGEPWEYSVVLTIQNAEGEEIARQVMGVGAVKPTEELTFQLEVEVLRPDEAGSPSATSE